MVEAARTSEASVAIQLRTWQHITEDSELKPDLVKDERGDFLADPQNILNRWKNYFCQFLNVQGADGIRQTEIQTAEPFLPGLSAAEFESLS
jgi:hypothetical protein